MKMSTPKAKNQHNINIELSYKQHLAICHCSNEFIYILKIMSIGKHNVQNQKLNYLSKSNKNKIKK